MTDVITNPAYAWHPANLYHTSQDTSTIKDVHQEHVHINPIVAYTIDGVLVLIILIFSYKFWKDLRNRI